ncbi:helix-turn-helix domain-containing protein [Alkalihalobacillus deserti]|uniref:helix-turn-helix domain-containing protein n=1 Tax=Alkalihalobacillus deserti TaxID=2879466 RepID=UPI001D139C72|nr:helix-turn-helix domain-containing protein [Alkalihalobacillus deserti]
MEIKKRDELIKRVENHLRMTARQLVKFDTEEETLQYLIDSFRSELACDFVGIILKDGENLVPGVTSGASVSFFSKFPLYINNCSSEILTRALTYEEIKRNESCELSHLLKKEIMSTWFTVPIKEERNSYGFCIIGFMNSVALLKEMEPLFVEFGKDVAVAISLAKRKEVQKKQIQGAKWISENISLNSSIEKVVEKIVERAGKGTNSKVACIYLYNEQENCFIYQPPCYGEMSQSKRIEIDDNNILKEYFPFLETTGGNQLSVPLVLELKTIGVLHVENKTKGVFIEEDLEILELLSNHVAAMLENARLYNIEKYHKNRLHSLLDYQHALVKETVEADHFEGITKTLSTLFTKSVVLFDRFMRPIAYNLWEKDEADLPTFLENATYAIVQRKNRELPFMLEPRQNMNVETFPINGGGDLLGYLVIEMGNENIDDFLKLGIDLSLNIYSLQFMKQKLVFDTKEQVKDSFINKLLVEEIKDQESIIQYANLFKWDLFDQHRVVVLSILLDDRDSLECNILEQEAKKSLLWEHLKKQIRIFDQDMIVATNKEEYILIVPTVKEKKKPKVYWSTLYQQLKEWMKGEKALSTIFMGIGGKTEKLEDYYTCYQQGVQTLSVVNQRFKDLGFAFFEELGAYTLLNDLRDSASSTLFVNKHLGPLINYSKGKNMDLFQTLRIFLYHNGSIKETSEELFIHRSSLLYRLEKIESLLEVDLHYSEHRFNFMLAYKLYDLYYSNA